VLLLTTGLHAAASQEVDAGIKALVDRFFETQQAEDVQGYLALWTSKGGRPSPEQLKYIFDSGEDKFLDVAIERVTVTGDTARARIAATRVRTDARMKNPDGSPRMFSTRLQLALGLIREDGEWKIDREGTPSDELAAALIESGDPAARRALFDSEPQLLTARLVEALARKADAIAQAQQFKAAQSIYERSLEVAQVIGDRKAEGQALQNIGNSLYFQREFAAALTFYERRLAIEREISNDEGVANALLGIATIRYSIYEYGAALEAYRQALAIQERLQDELLIATTLISTGNVLYLQGDYEAAIADYRRAETLKRKYFDLGGAATALEGLGRVYSAQGDYAAALSAFAGVLAERRQRNDIPRRALVLQSIGEVHFRLGNTDQARLSFDESRRDFESVKDPGGAGRVLHGAALNELVAGRFAAGEKAYTDSIALCTRASDDECIARAQVGLAFALAAQQKYDDAITWYGRSLISLDALKMQEAGGRARVGLAEALAGKGEYEKALEQAAEARHTAVILANDDLLWRALISQARAERKLGRPVEALGSARAALLAVQRLTAAAKDRPAQGVPRDTTAAYATTAVLQAEADDGEGAFLTSEQMRAHGLWISLASHERDITRGMTESERAEERALAAELKILILRRDRQAELPKPDQTQIEKLDASIKEVTGRRNAAREELFARLPDLRRWRGLAPARAIDELTILLNGAGTVFLQFVVDEHDVVVLLASRRESTTPIQFVSGVVTIERHALAERIGRALDGRALGDVVLWRKASAELFDLLPQKFRAELEAAGSIVIVPDDVLWRVPFEALPVETGYLADHATITYATSVASAARFRGQDAGGAAPAPPEGGENRIKGPVLAIASPRLAQPLLEMLTATAPTWAIRSAEAGLHEMQRVSNGLKDPRPVVLSEAAATRMAVLAALPSAGAIHIAAPFRINPTAPLFSPILLAAAGPEEQSAVSRGADEAKSAVKPGSDPGQGSIGAVSDLPKTRVATLRGPSLATTATPDDGQLEARELFNLSTTAVVVTLSDPSSLSMRDAAAAIVPIQWAWRAAGVPALIVRRWAGADDAAADILARFYAELRAGRSAGDALHAARAAVRSTEDRRAPAYWAGWLILSGG
jgi:tetratricopeptide (TPR) repeat protein